MSEPTQQEQFTDTPHGWASRLTQEFSAARKALKDWHEEAQKALDAYLGVGESKRCGIYTADSQTQEAMLYGELPKVGVSRAFADANDHLARVGSEILERILNNDIEDGTDSFANSLGHVTHDRQHTAFGCARVRYVRGETQTQPGRPAITSKTIDPVTGQEVEVETAPAVPDVELRPNEQAPTDYVHFMDFLYGPCRVWDEVPWVAFGADIPPRDIDAKFGEGVAATLPRAKKDRDEKKVSPWERIRLWEVWVKESREVFFFVEGHEEVLKTPDCGENGGLSDPLRLDKFFPCPEPIFANTTTRSLVPKPDYSLHRHRYRAIDTLEERIDMLEEAVRVVGAYDKDNTALQSMLSGDSMRMIPVDNWAMLAEKGGIKGVVDWFPLEQVVNALTVLTARHQAKVDSLRQLTGMSDIIRGQASEVGTTATSDRITARFASVRMQKRQKELARFATDLQKLRAEVMAKHFSESTYLARCNCENTADKELAPKAVQLLKSEFSKYRVEVKPEAISMTDFDALKQERTEVIAAIGQFLEAAQPLLQTFPGSVELVGGLLQFLLAGIRGGSNIEGLVDQAVAQLKQQAAQPQQQAPDPKLQAQQMKGQQDMAKIDKELQADVVRAQVDVQAERAKQAAQTEFNVREHKEKLALSPPKMAGPSGAPR